MFFILVGNPDSTGGNTDWEENPGRLSSKKPRSLITVPSSEEHIGNPERGTPEKKIETLTSAQEKIQVLHFP